LQDFKLFVNSIDLENVDVPEKEVIFDREMS
jgi:hypothetical protein